MIRTENVIKHFEDCVALKGVSCHIESGSIYGLVGSNGAGKSTFLRLVSGVYQPDSGSILIDGEPVYDAPAVKNRMILVPDEPYFLPGASLKRMAQMYESFYPGFDRERFHHLTESFRLSETRSIHGFSKGMKRQAAILLALSLRPDYYFFDETFDGLDPIVRKLVKGLISEDVADRKATAIITSHSLRELEDLCDQLALLHEGGLILESDVSELKTSLFKVQIAFTDPFDERAFQGLDVENCEINGTVAQLILRGDREIVMEELQAMDPVLLNMLPLNLEEIFTYELKERGYSFEEILEQEARSDEKEDL